MPDGGGRAAGGTVWTVGHSNHAADRFVGLLRQNDISVVADVRTSPYSRFSPQFNKDQLQAHLKASGIQYVFLGAELGGRPADPAAYDDDGHVRYDRVAVSDTFNDGLDRLLRGIAGYRVAVMCGEEDPISCHRRRLVGRALLDRGVNVEHIRGDGTVTTEAQVREREERDFPERFQMTLDGPPPWRSEHAVQRRPEVGGEGWSDS